MNQVPLDAFTDIETSAATVTCIIPVYNVEKFLDRCMISVLNQTRPFDEIILIDDGAKDSSGKMCDKYAEQYANVRAIHQQNGGLSAARNTGISQAKGDYLVFVDSDDWISSTYVELLLKIALKTDADMVVGQLARVSTEEEFKRVEAEDANVCKGCMLYTRQEFMKIFMRFEGNRAVHFAPAKLYRRQVIEQDHFPVGLLNEDVEGGFKALLNARTVSEVRNHVYAYYFNEKSITGSGVGENYLNLLQVWSRVESIARQRAPEVVPMVEYNVKRADFTMLSDMAVHGNSLSDARLDGRRRGMQKRLRKNLHDLLDGPMPRGRKVAMVMLAYAYAPTAALLRLAKVGPV